MSSLSLFDADSASGGTTLLDPPEHASTVPAPWLGGGDFPPPPDGWGGDGGGGDGDGDDGEERSERPSDDSAAFGLGLVLAAIATLFLIFLAAFVVLRSNAAEWPPAGSPRSPLGMWISTLLLLVSSVTVARAVGAARSGDGPRATRDLAATLTLGALFLVSQATLWGDLVTSGFFPSSNGYGAIFYALTGLHAAHIVGGLVYLSFVLVRQRLAFGEARRSVPLCAAYWHFMGGIWVVLVAALWA